MSDELIRPELPCAAGGELKNFIPLSRCPAIKRESPVAYHGGQYYDAGQFHAAVGYWADRFRPQPFQRYALYTADAYPFAVLLFALVHAGKDVWIPGNNRPGTAEQLTQLDCRLTGDWEQALPFDYQLRAAAGCGRQLPPLDAENVRLFMFTSGSTGLAKAVEKRLSQLEAEIATLEKQWGQMLQNAAALSTVSHQHIYGLLFRVLWPLSAGRCFHSRIYISPETLLRGAQDAPAYWVASPAHLKRLDQASPWQGIAGLKAVFSSGGPLHHDAAEQIFTCSGQHVIEIYGSTETGGIAWRRQDNGAVTPWRLFDGLKLSGPDDNPLLHSPYLGSNEGLRLDDRISLLDDGRFILRGRLDRIVKIEEKRLSLTELERRLQDTPWIAEAYAMMLVHHRDVVGVAAVLTGEGSQQLTTLGRAGLIKRLRAELSNWFDAVVLPRKWLFVNSMPLTSNGKTDHQLLMRMLGPDSHKLPHLLGLELSADRAELLLRVPEDLVYFRDHFQTFPILPGVVQIAWADYFGKLLLAIEEPFAQMEVIKFVKIIPPGIELKLSLDWKPSSGKLYFQFGSDSGTYSSGRMVYGVKT